MTTPIPAPPSRAVEAYTGYVSPNGLSTIARELREIDRLRAEVEKAQLEAMVWRDREAEARVQLQELKGELAQEKSTGDELHRQVMSLRDEYRESQIRIQELEAELSEQFHRCDRLESKLAAVRAERDTARATGGVK